MRVVLSLAEDDVVVGGTRRAHQVVIVQRIEHRRVVTVAQGVAVAGRAAVQVVAVLRAAEGRPTQRVRVQAAVVTRDARRACRRRRLRGYGTLLACR